MKTAEEFKGTNGEWKIQEPYNTFVYGSDGKLICQIKYDPFSEESTANAHLISASPELLKSLQELVEINEQRLEGAASWSLAKLWFRKTWDATERANKAINKALGL